MPAYMGAVWASSRRNSQAQSNKSPLNTPHFLEPTLPTTSTPCVVKMAPIPLGTVGWTPSPNTRGTLEILFSNFLALFVCVWTVLRHNLQARDDGYWTVFFRKCRWAVLAITAPEMLTLFSVMQWNAANISVKQMEPFCRGRGPGVEWTKVHAFYANAGGFLLQAPDFPTFPINATSIHYLCSQKRISVPPISRDNIWDRSKADHFAKGFALLQAGWVLLQVLARHSQQLTVTSLEVFTAAFIVPSLATSFFWASKPQHVAEPTIITVP